MANKTKVSPQKEAAIRRDEDKQIEKAARIKGIAHHGSGFVNFIREQGVIGLAVGLAIGAAAGDTVKKLVEGFINPIVQFLVGSQDRLASSVWQFELWGRTADFAWGAFVSSAITLIATALVIYLIVHYAKLDKLDKKK
ncbi:MAG: MscL family protein [Candidatus Saccharimonas sp.]